MMQSYMTHTISWSMGRGVGVQGSGVPSSL